jgi:hypothetical protein
VYPVRVDLDLVNSDLKAFSVATMFLDLTKKEKVKIAQRVFGMWGGPGALENAMEAVLKLIEQRA